MFWEGVIELEVFWGVRLFEPQNKYNVLDMYCSKWIDKIDKLFFSKTRMNQNNKLQFLRRVG